MHNVTSRQLYRYWDSVRNGRPAPQRFEIEPAKIASLLPETFIVECGSPIGYRFRLAGTRICEQFGRELRGVDFLSLWSLSDRERVANMLSDIVCESAVGAMLFDGKTKDARSAGFVALLLPLVHAGASVNRIMGCISAQQSPYWLGSVPLVALALRLVEVDWPPRGEERPSLGLPRLSIFSGEQTVVVRDSRRRFRVFEGGLAESKD